MTIWYVGSTKNWTYARFDEVVLVVSLTASVEDFITVLTSSGTTFEVADNLFWVDDVIVRVC
jgi:hypothetical protein